MIVQDIRHGTMPVLSVLQDGSEVFRRDNGIALVTAQYEQYGVQAICDQYGVITVNGRVAGVTAVFLRLSHSLVSGTTNTVLADPNYVIVPAKKRAVLRVETLGGSCTSTADGFNLVLRDSTNTAAVNCKYADGMREAAGTCDNPLAVFCLYMRNTCTFDNLRLLVKLTVE